MSPSDPKCLLTREAGQGRSAETPETPLATPRKRGLLVVDDEEGMRGVLEAGMRQEGFAVWLAATGQKALDLYRQHGRVIDMVLLDVCMPGLDGPQTLAGLRKINPQVRCCFMSGDLGSYTGWRLYNLGAAALIRKPFHLGEVAQVLWELLSSAERTDREPLHVPNRNAGG